MAMNRIPTLILGIGGIGCRIAAGVSDMLSAEDREYVGVVGMDTNVNDLKKMEEHGMKTIQTSDDRRVRDYLQLHPEYMSWFPVNRFTVDKGMVNGAGQIRAISRLAALASEESGAFIPIEEEIKRIRKNKGTGSNGNLTVMVVGSITGGTGAGIFLQMPYYIRRLMKNADGLDAIVIRGMFIGPDITVNVNPSKINRAAVRVNGYACLKELNALYMTQVLPNSENKIRLEYYEKSNQEEEMAAAKLLKSSLDRSGADALLYDDDFPVESLDEDRKTIASSGANIPYDYLYLIEGSSASGGIGNVALSNVENQVSHMVFTLMFTPVRDNALSVEDNMVLQDMAEGGMNRYSSAGLCRIVFPKEIAQEYVTLCTVRSMVKDEWLILDRKYNDAVIDARSRQRTDGMVEIPQLKKMYPALFEKEVKGDGKLGKLYKEAFVETADHAVVSRAVSIMRTIENQVKEVLEADEVIRAQSECELKEENMKKFADAEIEIGKVYTALEEYRKLAKRLIKEKQGQLANDLFPPSWESMRNRMDSKICIYQWLYHVHPITARYLCYDLILRLEKRIAVLEGKIAGIDLDDYLQEDFDPKEKGIQTPDAALRRIREKKMLGVVSIGDEGRKLLKLRKKVKEVSETQTDLLTDYIRFSLELSTCQTLLNRTEQLSENYRIFFQTIGTMIEENNDRISRLEEVRMPLGQMGVYCSKEAFHAMAAEYRSTVDDELPLETKKAVFEQLFRVLADDFNTEGKELTEHQKENRAVQKRIALTGIFRTAVIDTINTDVRKYGAGIVDMNARQALIKQMQLETGKFETNCRTFKEDSIEYIRDKIQTAMKMADPMLAVNRATFADNTETVYLALHPDCAEMQEGKPDAGATKELYIPEATEATDNMPTTVLMDKEFSAYEIICFKARYKFLIEDLVKYQPNSENAKAYRTRIQNIGKRPVNENDPDAFKTVVNPHLDRYWHEEGFIPEMSADARRKSKEDTLKAFVYAMGMDTFRKIIDEDHPDENNCGRPTWYVYTPQGYAPVKSCGRLIGNSYADLYESLFFNRRIKAYILQQAAAVRKKMKGYSDVEELFERILENWLIEDLIQSKEDRDGEEDDNILDIFLQMREHMKGEKWNELFNGLQETLWEFCAYLFDESERLVNIAVPEILKMTYRYSKAGCREIAGEKLSYGEMRMKEQVKMLLNKRYHK